MLIRHPVVVGASRPRQRKFQPPPKVQRAKLWAVSYRLLLAYLAINFWNNQAIDLAEV